MTGHVIGIDVQVARDCPFAVLNSSATVIQSGWISHAQPDKEAQRLASIYQGAIFAIDAPRMPLPAHRAWEWNKDKAWRHSSGKRGRHCEIVLKALGLANPQWTPLEVDAPDWMRLGFRIFHALSECNSQALEVFPSASYRMLNNDQDVRVNMPLGSFLNGPKDMLDAIVAAVTGHEYLAGRGEAVGGGDGLGTIVLPRKILQSNSAVLNWPV